MALIDDHALARVWAKIKAMFVAKETGKGLSTNDYTTAEKNKLAGIAAGANAYTHPAYTARTGKPTGDYELGFGESFLVSQVTSDSTGHVTGMTDREIIMPSEMASADNAGLMSITDKMKLDGIPTALGVFARNVGNIEGELQTVREENAAIKQALDAQSVQILNTPNLLRPDAWWLNNGSANIVCGDAARWSKSGGAYMKSITNYVIFSTEPTEEQTAGSTYVYHREAYTDSETGTSYPEAWYVYRDADDGITTSCVDLTGDAIITEPTGETFNKAIQYNITANTAWGNMETLYYPQGQSTAYYKQGETAKSYGYRIDEMEVGKSYTVSCWARVISGDGAWLKFGWGGTYMNGMGFPSDKSGVSDVIKITGTEWQRVHWSFVFDPSGAEYSETTEQATDSNNQTYTRVVRSYNWQKRVMIGVHRKYTATLQLAGFRLTRGGLYGNNTIDTLAAEVAAASEASADNTAQMNNLLASVAPVEASTTASANHSAGELLVLNGKLYKASTAIVTGDTLTVGTNITATTLAAELAALNA